MLVLITNMKLNIDFIVTYEINFELWHLCYVCSLTNLDVTKEQ